MGRNTDVGETEMSYVTDTGIVEPQRLATTQKSESSG